MSDPIRQVYLVDDDTAVLQALSRLLRCSGYEPVAFTSAKAFMQAYQEGAPGCLVLDVSMPEMTGLDLQQWLATSGNHLPVIFLTGHGDIPTSVQAMKHGAIDFLTKPVNKADLLTSIEEAFQRAMRAYTDRTVTEAIQAKLAKLTPRERQVLEHVVSGKLNKQTAAELGTTEKTIKFHRANVMAKMGTPSLAELARFAERVGIGRVDHGPLPQKRPGPQAQQR